MPTILITGANRGLGLEFARQYAADGWQVIGTCRNPADATVLSKLARTRVESLDVTDPARLERLAERLGDEPVDVLLLNAAVHLQKDNTLEQLDPVRWLEELRVNVIATAMVARRLIPNVARSEQKKIVAISSGSGSITNMKRTGGHAYKSGKAALNMTMRVLANELKTRGITVVPVAPGHTRTDMGGAEAPYAAEDSVARVRSVIAGLRLEDSGTLFDRDGSRLPF